MWYTLPDADGRWRIYRLVGDKKEFAGQLCVARGGAEDV